MEQEVTQALERLGTDVAQTLRSRGVTGVLGNTHQCPIARYLKQETGSEDINAAGSRIYYSPAHPDRAKANTDFVPTPGPVAVFMHWFDRSQYPDLIDN